MIKDEKISISKKVLFYILTLIIVIVFLITIILMFLSGTWLTGVNCKGYVSPPIPKSCQSIGGIGLIPPGSGCGGINCGNSCINDADCMEGLKCQSVFGQGKVCAPIG